MQGVRAALLCGVHGQVRGRLPELRFKADLIHLTRTALRRDRLGFWR
jgi:hypothetical protein